MHRSEPGLANLNSLMLPVTLEQQETCLTITSETAFLLLVRHSQCGQAQKWSLLLLCGLAWAVTQYQSWLPDSDKFGLSGYFKAQYYFSLLAKSHEVVAELRAGEGCVVCNV